jgi:hypothetical protein
MHMMLCCADDVQHALILTACRTSSAYDVQHALTLTACCTSSAALGGAAGPNRETFSGVLNRNGGFIAGFIGFIAGFIGFYRVLSGVLSRV